MTDIFVFPSNLAGRHGKGAALEAWHNHGAEYGVGLGPTGNAYAIPTKDESLRVLPLSRIKVYIERFMRWAEAHPECVFNVVPIGCGLAGYEPRQIAPFFKKRLGNVKLPPEFVAVLRHKIPA